MVGGYPRKSARRVKFDLARGIPRSWRLCVRSFRRSLERSHANECSIALVEISVVR
jgi:hypothetical protein